MPYAIQTNNLRRVYGDIVAVDALNIEVPKGTVMGMLGTNGAGKTTIIRMLLGLVAPTAGTAEVMGYDIKTQSYNVRQLSGALLEHDGIYERTSAEHNLLFWGRACHMSSQQIQSRIQQVLELFGLYERRKETVGEWSRGMKRKLGVARAMMNEPSMLFLDEPTSGLDPVSASEMRNHLSQIVQQQGVTVFLNTHNLSEAEQLCQQVAVLSKGHLLAYDTPRNIRSSASNNDVIVSGTNWPSMDSICSMSGVENASLQNDTELVLKLYKDAPMAPIVKELVLADAQIEEIRKNTVSLEQALLSLVEADKDGA